jgi:hypothetical protein
MFNVGAFTKDLIEHVIIIGLPRSALPDEHTVLNVGFLQSFSFSLTHTVCFYLEWDRGCSFSIPILIAHFFFYVFLSLTHTNKRYGLPVAFAFFSFLWPKHTGSIQVAPIATLRLGPTFKADSIKEGDDVYFECSIQANPDVTRLVWKHEVSRHT